MPLYFGDKIREARKAAGLTQRQLADKIKVTNTSISNWEKNLSRPDPDTIQNLCWALNVQPNYLFSEDGLNSDKSNVEMPMQADSIKAALWGGDKDFTPEDLDEMWADVQNFAAYIASQRKKEKK